ncbi:MAG: DUF4846 domain-containing protein [Saprospiraceae bacterium]|nr:DUF4846 domain-containing protein [Saprospiraceae bacterium]
MKKIILFSFILFACGNASDTSKIGLQLPNLSVSELENLPNISDDTNNKYAWLNNYDINTALINRIPVPKGYERIEVATNSFGDWLRHLSLKPYDAKMYLYNGTEKHRQDVHAAILNIDVGDKDLQQCADAVMRLKSEYHYSRGEFHKIHFNFTSGDKVSFDDWRFGRKPKISGNKVTFTPKTATANNSYQNFKSYMNMIFNYAGTYSLSQELKKKDVANIQAGDVFIVGGFPGHAMMVMDVAKNKDGKTIFLLSQSYMPAQSIHIVKNFNAESKTLGCWYSTDFGSILNTPEYTFQRENLKTW